MGPNGERGPVVAGDLTWVQRTVRTGRGCWAGKPGKTANQNHPEIPPNQDNYYPNNGGYHVLAWTCALLLGMENGAIAVEEGRWGEGGL